MPYRITQGGMLNGEYRDGGDTMSDADAEALINFGILRDLGYLVAVEDKPKPEPKPASKPTTKQEAT